MGVRVQVEDFDVGREIAQLRAGNAKIGAVAAFIGIVRDLNDAAEAKQRWEVYDALVVHRVGKLEPTDQIVLVAVCSAHRGDAFAACEFIMDYLKTKAPFWKKEDTPAGERWVEARASDDDAAARW